MATKTVIHKVKGQGFFVDRGTPISEMTYGLGKDGKAGWIPPVMIYDGTTGTGYYTREKAIQVAADYFDEVEIFIEDENGKQTQLDNKDVVSSLAVHELHQYLHSDTNAKVKLSTWQTPRLKAAGVDETSWIFFAIGVLESYRTVAVNLVETQVEGKFNLMFEDAIVSFTY